jgi:hypothetical protein
MAHRQIGGLGVIDADIERVSARGVEEPIAHHRANGMVGHHRLGDEAVDRAEDGRSIQRSACHDFQRRIEGKMSNEDREPAKRHAFQVREKPVAPIERRMQCFVTRRCGTRTLPQ